MECGEVIKGDQWVQRGHDPNDYGTKANMKMIKVDTGEKNKNIEELTKIVQNTNGKKSQNIWTP